jgi:hypothetical protein
VFSRNIAELYILFRHLVIQALLNARQLAEFFLSTMCQVALNVLRWAYAPNVLSGAHFARMVENA